MHVVTFPLGSHTGTGLYVRGPIYGTGPLMDAVCETGIFTKQEIISINRTRHHKGVHRIGDMTYSDGLSMDRALPVLVWLFFGTRTRTGLYAW